MGLDAVRFEEIPIDVESGLCGGAVEEGRIESTGRWAWAPHLHVSPVIPGNNGM
jgi:hypothetical protein